LFRTLETVMTETPSSPAMRRIVGRAMGQGSLYR
jgi:hypothetical protein